VDLVYEREGYIWRYPEERLFEGRDPALHEDGRIAYVDRFQGVWAVYIRQGDQVTLPFKPAYGSSTPLWAGDVLYFSGATGWGWWDGAAHWSDYSGSHPCWTPDGVYYVVWEGGVSSLYRDGELVIENAWQPAW
jgi:hypothetical protein